MEQGGLRGKGRSVHRGLGEYVRVLALEHIRFHPDRCLGRLLRGEDGRVFDLGVESGPERVIGRVVAAVELDHEFLVGRPEDDLRMVVLDHRNGVDHLLGQLVGGEDMSVLDPGVVRPAATARGAVVPIPIELDDEALRWPVLGEPLRRPVFGEPLLAGRQSLEEVPVRDGGVGVAVGAPEADFRSRRAHHGDVDGEERVTRNFEDGSAAESVLVAAALELGGPRTDVAADANLAENLRHDHEGTPLVVSRCDKERFEPINVA